jgi:integrase
MRRVRGRIEAILDYAIARGDREGENPAASGPILKGLPRQPKKNGDQHYEAMSYAKLPALVKKLREGNTVSTLALEFLVLTASRANEVCSARWDEINCAEKVWTIPAARMKSGRLHRIPLSDQAVQALERAANQTEFIFPGPSGEGLSTRALLKALPRAGGSGTVHGLRSTFRTWVQEATEFDGNIAEAALAHKTGDSTEQAYARSDLFAKRRKLMQAWAEYCGGA